MKRIKKRSELPKTYSELGFPEDIAMFFRLSGISTSDMLKRFRKLTLDSRNYHYVEKEDILRCNILNPYSLRNTEIRSIVGGEEVKLTINFEEVAWPAFTPYLNFEACNILYKLQRELAPIMIFSDHGGPNSKTMQLLCEYAASRYDSINRIRIDEGKVKRFVEKAVIKVGLKKDYEAAKRGEPIERHYVGPNLCSFLIHLTFTDEFVEVFKKSLYLEKNKKARS